MSAEKSIYHFDANRREYAKREDGKSSGPPIWIKHWQEVKVTGETKVSWIVGPEWGQIKVNKKKLAAGELRNYKATWNEVMDLAWVHDNKYRITEAVGRVDDIDTLKAIDVLLGNKS